MDGFHRNLGAFQPALYQTPEVLQAVRVDLAAHILDRVIYHFMLEFV
jgi:hypothetical protein